MTNAEERRLILEMVEAGKISPEEALGLLQAISDGDEDARLETESGLEALPASTPGHSNPGGGTDAVFVEPELHSETGQAQPPDFQRWRGFWLWPFWAGTAILTIGAALIYFALNRSMNPFWQVCAGMPFLLGLILMLIAWSSRNSRWLHLRIRQAPGETPETFAISFPLFFLGPIAQLLRWTRGRVSGFDQTSIDEVLMALDNSQGEGPLYIEVNDEEDGETVQIYIG